MLIIYREHFRSLEYNIPEYITGYPIPCGSYTQKNSRCSIRIKSMILSNCNYTWDPKPPSGFPKVSGFGIYESKPFPKPEINSETRNCFGPNYARLGQHYL
ncbi:hypothetical protein RclHR1_01980003 [Rhizophagus clarus]|uniref:Uncharacterized protein n=1 Tax=Rhizophagus clarus TaxID=94130 RepID=A0A2Z6RI61_9GLOM|nr:hypothetical protein RclHR1_01980003 [Rhizophagus clarus]